MFLVSNTCASIVAFRILSNIYDEALSRKHWTVFSRSLFFTKKLHHRFLAGSWILLWQWNCKSLNLTYYPSRLTTKGSFIYYVLKFFRKTNISYSLIRTRSCAYQGVRNISFSKNFAYVLNKWSLISSKKCQIFAMALYTTIANLIITSLVQLLKHYFDRLLEVSFYLL